MEVFHIHIKGTHANIFSIPLPKVNWFTYFSLALEPFSGHKVETHNRGELVTELCKNQWQNYVSIVKSRNDIDKLCKYLQLPPLSSYYSFTHDVSELFKIDASQQHHWSLKKKEMPESDARPVQSSKNSVIERGGVSCELLSMTWISKVVIHQRSPHIDFRRWWPCSEAN